jgi:photosystem II stability/assembly factor-like uncharacterized protein
MASINGHKLTGKRSSRIWLGLLAALAVVLPTTASHAMATRAASAPQVSLVSIHMNSGQSGWATSATALLRTTDGGTKWHAVTPSGLKIQPNIVPAASYLNSTTAWISDGFPTSNPGVYRTTDGGQTWQHSVLPPPARNAGPLSIKQIDFIDPRHGWLLEGLGGGAGTFYFALLRTTDGGAHWAAIAGGNEDPPAPGAYPRNVQGISFQNSKSGWTTVVIFAGPQLSGMYHTADGGHTWRKVLLPMTGAFKIGFFDIEPPTFFGANKGATLVASDTAAGLYVTGNGGMTWAPTTPLHMKVNVASAHPPSANLLDQKHAWIVVDSRLYFTSDLGRHWMSLNAASTVGNVTAIDFINSSTGWALGGPQSAGQQSLWKSTDGGLHWMELKPVMV